MHKEGMSMRPLVNLTVKALSYKLAKKLHKLLRHHRSLRNSYSVKNNEAFVQKTNLLLV